MSAQDSAYAPQWRDYRARRFWFFAVWLGGFLGLEVVTFGVLPLMPKAMADAIWVAVGVAWLLGWGAMAIRWQRFPCPRCDRPFLLLRPFSRECGYCGLARYE
ncbi:ATP-dependent helicase [Lysobacter enzymogenes]|uniref:ATP-dependent helicase n=1 Tax=Lysobacter enzymogenes TaxID=69 RepID=A0A0S2DQM5_LYSEN|nr:hypothetical protein [Lysobacter enzymogenes]ALN60729.1 ATP-dependent helicase [Lysobacter enzymogenes]QCW24322.1 hypothetical protein FE772_00215 [Lysobacter enzymogenes]